MRVDVVVIITQLHQPLDIYVGYIDIVLAKQLLDLPHDLGYDTPACDVLPLKRYVFFVVRYIRAVFNCDLRISRHVGSLLLLSIFFTEYLSPGRLLFL